MLDYAEEGAAPGDCQPKHELPDSSLMQLQQAGDGGTRQSLLCSCSRASHAMTGEVAASRVQTQSCRDSWFKAQPPSRSHNAHLAHTGSLSCLSLPQTDAFQVSNT